MEALHPELKTFADTQNLKGLSGPTLEKIKNGQGPYTIEKAKRFQGFLDRIEDELLNHRVITNNAYTAWFSRGDANLAQVKDLIVEFSVFSNLFLIAQLHKIINAHDIESMRSSKEILANEIGVIFRHPKQKVGNADNILSTEGTVDGGIFKFRAAHFEWMVDIADKLGLGYTDIGKRQNGSEDTLFFCDELVRLYGNPDFHVSQAASFAVENWAAAGFWQELVDGLKAFKDQHQSDLPIHFFDYHNKIEAQHAAHTLEELEEYYFEYDPIPENDYIRYGNDMLDGVARFWDGLEKKRHSL